MCLRLLAKLNVQNLAIAGFDGYKIDSSDNYVDSNILLNLNLEDKQLLNKELSEMFNHFKSNNKNINIDFLTNTYLKIATNV